MPLPAARRFLKLACSDATWSPGWPRRLQGLAVQHKVTVPVPGYFDLLSAGFHRYDRPWRLVQALVVIFRPQQPQGCAGYIYEDRDLLLFGDDAPRRWGAPESFVKPTWHTSPAGSPPVADMPEPAMPAAPVGAPSKPPRGTIIER